MAAGLDLDGFRMPVMDGLSATKQIRARLTRNSLPATRNPIIIALTASVFEDARDEFLAAGCDDFLRKPFKEADMFKMIENTLGFVIPIWIYRPGSPI